MIQTQNILGNTTTYLRFSKFSKIKRDEGTDYFLETLFDEQNMERTDYKQYNSGMTELSGRIYSSISPMAMGILGDEVAEMSRGPAKTE